MRELVLVGGLVAVLAATSGMMWLPWLDVAKAGAGLLALGFAFGVPTAVVYHVLLHRSLAPRGLLPRGWIWRPMSLHDRLLPEQRGTVLGFCYAGGAGFVVICLGVWLLAVATVSALVSV